MCRVSQTEDITDVWAFQLHEISNNSTIFILYLLLEIYVVLYKI